MANVPAELKYAKSHEWVRLEGDNATVGITDHAQHELTDVVFVELPEPGKTVKPGDACAVVESVKTASDIYSPVGGEITQINKALEKNPALVNTDPYGEGWMFKVKLASNAVFDSLLTADQYVSKLAPNNSLPAKWTFQLKNPQTSTRVERETKTDSTFHQTVLRVVP